MSENSYLDGLLEAVSLIDQVLAKLDEFGQNTVNYKAVQKLADQAEVLSSVRESLSVKINSCLHGNE